MKIFQRAGTVFVVLFAAACNSSGESDPGSGDDGNSAIAVATTPDSIEIIGIPDTGVHLGWGWNKGDHEPIPTICVEFVEGREPAQTKYMTMKEVSDSYELMQSMGMSAEASVKTIGFEVEGKAAFAKSTNVTGFSSTFVLNATVQNGVRYAAPRPKGWLEFDPSDPRMGERGGTEGAIRLTSEAQGLAAKDRTEFRRRCGSSFVSAIYGGAKLTAVMTMSSSSRAEKESMSASMSGGGWGARFEGSIKGKSESEISNNSMELSIFQTGGTGDAIPATKDQLLAKLDVISLDAYNAPKDFNIAITPYDVLENWPGEEIPDRATEFDELAAYWGAYNTLYDEIQAILDDPLDYAAVNVDADGCVDVVNSSMVQSADVAARLRELQVEFSDGLGAGVFSSILRYSEEMRALASASPVLQAADNMANRADLRRAQDEVLITLRQIQDVAQECVSKSDTCLFNASDYRDPYAYRLQLMPPDRFATNSQELIDILVTDSAKRRCAISPDNPGCITNAEIDAWHAKVGLRPIRKQDDEALYNALLVNLDNKEHTERAACTNGTLATPAVSVEAGADVLWINPQVFP